MCVRVLGSDPKSIYFHVCVSSPTICVCLQPVADKPFTFETELDDLPKERLKCKQHNYYITYATLISM